MPFGIYVHYPYCSQICPYCDFSIERANSERYLSYTSALIEEFERRVSDFGGFGDINSVYFGGGTPSIWPAAELSVFVAHLRSRFPSITEAEVTIEVNPEDVSLDYFLALQDMGVNRISIGVQSLDDRVLERLGRVHRENDVLVCIDMLRRTGFQNWTVDLVHGLAGQSMISSLLDVKRVVDLGAPHVSIYQITVESGTAFDSRTQRGEQLVAGEGDLIAIYKAITSKLIDSGFEHYEISNAAKPGHESQHNLGYWLGLPYMGLGAGAHGFYPLQNEAVRYANISGAESYVAALQISESCEGIEHFRERLSEGEFAEDLLLTGLRLKDGLTPNRYMRQKFTEQVDRLCVEGLMSKDRDRWSVTQRGRLILDHVIHRILL